MQNVAVFRYRFKHFLRKSYFQTVVNNYFAVMYVLVLIICRPHITDGVLLFKLLRYALQPFIGGKTIYYIV